MSNIFVFRYGYTYGDGLFFVKAESKDEALKKLMNKKQHIEPKFTYLGTLRTFLKKLKEELEKEEIVGFYWEG